MNHQKASLIADLLVEQLIAITSIAIVASGIAGIAAIVISMKAATASSSAGFRDAGNLAIIAGALAALAILAALGLVLLSSCAKESRRPADRPRQGHAEDEEREALGI